MENKGKTFLFIIGAAFAIAFSLLISPLLVRRNNNSHSNNGLIASISSVNFINHSLSDERHDITINSLNLLFDLAKETKQYFSAIFAFNKINKDTNLGSFISEQIDVFVSMDIKFAQLSNHFMVMAHKDKDLKEIGALTQNLSLFCKRYVDCLIMISKNSANIENSVIGARTKAEFQRDWNELLSSSISFVRRNKKLLGEDDLSYFRQRLISNFGQNIDECLAYYTKNGDLAGLEFYDGGWLPVSIYLELTYKS